MYVYMYYHVLTYIRMCEYMGVLYACTRLHLYITNVCTYACRHACMYVCRIVHTHALNQGVLLPKAQDVDPTACFNAQTEED